MALSNRELWTQHPLLLESSGPGVDVIGDVHGCYLELLRLLQRLGYVGRHMELLPNDGRVALFVGDFVDRGPASASVLALLHDMRKSGTMEGVMGNHDWKIYRALMGVGVKLRDGHTETLAEIDIYEKIGLLDAKAFFGGLFWQILWHVPGHADLVVCHAGMPRDYLGKTGDDVRKHCLYGDVHGRDEDAHPIRKTDWIETWSASDTDPVLVRGHDVVPTIFPPTFHSVFNVDQGCVFGGCLTAFRYPEYEIVQIPAAETYRPMHAPSVPQAKEDSLHT